MLVESAPEDKIKTFNTLFLCTLHLYYFLTGVMIKMLVYNKLLIQFYIYV